MLDAEGGAALRSAIDSLAKRLGPDDRCSAGQRRADGLVEIVHHAMDQGTLQRRHGVRPHVTVITTPEALRGGHGAPASELEGGLPVSSKTAQRLACSGDPDPGFEIGVGGHGRREGDASGFAGAVASAQGEASLVRVGRMRPADRLDEPTPHRVLGSRRQERSAQPVAAVPSPPPRGSRRGWQIVKAGEGLKFVPPDRVVFRRARGPGLRWAA